MTAYYVMPSGGGGDDSGDSWANAMQMSTWLTHMTNTVSAGDIYYVAGGTYTLTGNFSTSRNGAANGAIRIIGVNSGTTNEPPIQSDWADEDNRPLMAGAGYYMTWAGYWWIYNLRTSSTGATHAFSVGTRSLFLNCKVTKTGGTYGFLITSGACIDCESSVTGGRAFSGGYRLRFCYAHDSTYGAYYAGTMESAVYCIIDSCTYGIYAGHGGFGFMNTFYNCTDGWYGSTRGSQVVVCCLFDSCTTGIQRSDAYEGFHDYNNFYNCTNNYTTNKCDTHYCDTAYNPDFEDAAGGDFRLKEGSACRDTCFSMRLGVG